jgi:hypothetical protein
MCRRLRRPDRASCSRDRNSRWLAPERSIDTDPPKAAGNPGSVGYSISPLDGRAGGRACPSASVTSSCASGCGEWRDVHPGPGGGSRRPRSARPVSAGHVDDRPAATGPVSGRGRRERRGAGLASVAARRHPGPAAPAEAVWRPVTADRPCRCSGPCQHGQRCNNGDDGIGSCTGRLVHVDRYPGSLLDVTAWYDEYACDTCNETWEGFGHPAEPAVGRALRHRARRPASAQRWHHDLPRGTPPQLPGKHRRRRVRVRSAAARTATAASTTDASATTTTAAARSAAPAALVTRTGNACATRNRRRPGGHRPRAGVVPAATRRPPARARLAPAVHHRPRPCPSHVDGRERRGRLDLRLTRVARLSSTICHHSCRKPPSCRRSAHRPSRCGRCWCCRCRA